MSIRTENRISFRTQEEYDNMAPQARAKITRRAIDGQIRSPVKVITGSDWRLIYHAGVVIDLVEGQPNTRTETLADGVEEFPTRDAALARIATLGLTFVDPEAEPEDDGPPVVAEL